MHDVHEYTANVALDASCLWAHALFINQGESHMFVITGATGNTGSVAVETLLSQGKKVRAVVRDAAKAERLAKLGAEIVVADLSDQAAFSRVVEGATGVYFLSP